MLRDLTSNITKSTSRSFLSKVSAQSNRDSLSSLKSSDEENRPKIELNQQINPIRPLRPSRSTTGSGGASNQSSRPQSHVSDDGGLSLSLVPNGSIDLSSTSLDSKDDNHLDVSIPPPKPPKTRSKIRLNGQSRN